MLPVAAAGIGLGAKLLGGLFGNKSKKKQQEASNKAAIAAADLADQRREDERIAGVDAGSSLLGSVGQASAYGGRVNPNMALDPELVARLKQRRKYNNASAVPAAGSGLGSAFLSSLFGGLGDLAAYLPTGADMPAGGPSIAPLGSTYDPTSDPFNPKYRK